MGGGEAKAAAGLGGAGIAAEDLVSGEFGADPPAIVEGGPGEGIAGEIELTARFDGGDKFGVDGSRVGGIEKPGVDDVALEVDDFGVGGRGEVGGDLHDLPRAEDDSGFREFLAGGEEDAGADKGDGARLEASGDGSLRAGGARSDGREEGAKRGDEREACRKPERETGGATAKQWGAGHDGWCVEVRRQSVS